MAKFCQNQIFGQNFDFSNSVFLKGILNWKTERVTKIIIFCLSLMKVETTAEFSIQRNFQCFFCMFTGMKIVSSIFAYSYFLFLQLCCCLQYDKINLSLQVIFKGEEEQALKALMSHEKIHLNQGCKIPYDTQIACMSQQELSFFGLT